MTSAHPQLGSRADIDVEVAALRQSGHHIKPVRWQGQAAWLKLSVPQSPAWRYQLLAGMARLLQQPALQPVRPQGGIAGIQNEMHRLAALGRAGLRVPQVLAHADHWLLLADLGQTTLHAQLRSADAASRLALWQRGADYIQQVHHVGQYLSQAFARNLVWSDADGLAAIDFEDDPASVMSLHQAQIRDWLPYLYSTAYFFRDDLPTLTRAVDAVLAREQTVIRDGVTTAMRRITWLRALRWLPQGMQRRDVQKTQCMGELAYRHVMQARTAQVRLRK